MALNCFTYVNGYTILLMLGILMPHVVHSQPGDQRSNTAVQSLNRERISLNEGWKFMRYASDPDHLIYDVRPIVTDRNDNIVADSKPTESVKL